MSDPIDLNRHVYGEPGAAITVIEYGDFECPYCGAAAPVLRRLVDGSDGRVRMVFRHFPVFTKHPHALTAALATEASGDRFWAMHDLLYAHQDRLTEADLIGWAEQAGVLDPAQVVGERAQRFQPAVQADYGAGVEDGARGTPTVFVDGRLYEGRIELGALRSTLGLGR